jgi:hypothetical protein
VDVLAPRVKGMDFTHRVHQIMLMIVL